MTKLFSVKSLAFAGAAAFALTLVAAPQADAAEATGKITLDVSHLEHVTVTRVANDIERTETEDGPVIYYQVAKSADKIKDGKYTAIADENLGYYNLFKFAGKEQYLSISPDGKKDTATGVAIKAAPKLKVKYSAADGLEIKINNQDATITSGSGIDGVKAKVGTTVYSVHGVDANSIKSNSVLGGTLEVYVMEDNPTDGVASASKVAKLKIAGKPKAPKASLKLDATKAFSWKINNKQEYRITVGGNSTEAGKWITGSGSADGWATIVEKGISKAVADSVVSGDAILADTTISLRTKKDKKPASAINVIKLEKSADSPTSTAVTVEMTKATYKSDGKLQKATGAAIKAAKDIQYSVETGKWKKLGTGKTAKLKDTNKTVLVRFAGESKKGTVLPSMNTTITIDYQTGKAVASGLENPSSSKDNIIVKPEEYTAK